MSRTKSHWYARLQILGGVTMTDEQERQFGMTDRYHCQVGLCLDRDPERLIYAPLTAKEARKMAQSLTWAADRADELNGVTT